MQLRISDSHYAMGLTTIFLVVGTITASHHEMWRDEIQAWLLARDSSSFIALFSNLKYEGHPALWHICLLPLSRITQSPVIMQAFHLLVAATTVYLFTRYSPFTRLQHFLFSFGYFSLYEYAIVSRNYAPGVLLLCLFCLLFQRRYARFLWVSTVLFLLGHTSVHALIITIAIGFAFLLDYLSSRKQILAAGTIHEWHIWMGFALIALGVITSAWQLAPPADSGFGVGWRTAYDANYLKSVIKVMTRAFFPVPVPTLHFWGSNVLDVPERDPLFAQVTLAFSYLLPIWFSVVLLRKPTALLIYLSGTIGLLGFFYVKFFGSIRHHGFLFMLFIAVAWVYRDSKEVTWFTPLNHLSRAWDQSLSPILTLILIFHLAGGIIAIWMDERYIFSYGKAAAAFIQERNLQDLLMVGETDYAVVTIVGYLGKDRVYYPRGDRYGSFVIWDQARTQGLSDDQVVQKAKELSLESTRDVLLILNHALPPNTIPHDSLTELARFTGSTIGDEGFYLYLMGRVLPAK